MTPFQETLVTIGVSGVLLLLNLVAANVLYRSILETRKVRTSEQGLQQILNALPHAISALVDAVAGKTASKTEPSPVEAQAIQLCSYPFVESRVESWPATEAADLLLLRDAVCTFFPATGAAPFPPPPPPTSSTRVSDASAS